MDAMLHLRDFSHFGIGGEELLRLPEDYGVPCFYIHGNHEAMGASRPGLPPLDRGEAVALDGRMQIVNGVRLLGFAPLGSSPRAPFKRDPLSRKPLHPLSESRTALTVVLRWRNRRIVARQPTDRPVQSGSHDDRAFP